MYRFTEFFDKCKYPPKFRTLLYKYHQDIFTYVCNNFDGSKKFKQHVCNCINYIAFSIMTNQYISNWDSNNPLTYTIPVDLFQIKNYLGSLFVDVDSIVWDIEIVDTVDSETKNVSITTDIDTTPHIEYTPNLSKFKIQDTMYTSPSDLFLQGPEIPRFDETKVWKSKIIDGRKYVIYVSLPEIPTKQSEISVTTDFSMMTDSELLHLFPNRVLYTRLQPMYQQFPNIDYEPVLGSILSISGFTKDQVLDNIIKYPHFENLYRRGQSNGITKFVDFWRYIEIDGELHKTLDVWDKLDDTKLLPKSKAMMKDYVTRRYLLERDIQHIDHKYKMFGNLSPFLTLFMPMDDYIKYGYKDVVSIAKSCVISRVQYKQSRNPILRRMYENV